MKHLVFVVHNLRVGGVQQSLVSLVGQLVATHRVTLVVFDREQCAYELPPEVELRDPGGLVRVLGSAQMDLPRFTPLWLWGALLRLMSRAGLQRSAYWLAMVGSRRIEDADGSISYMHPSAPGTFQGGTAEYVLRKVPARRRACFVHADVVNARIVTKQNARVLARFDVVAAVSESVAQRVRDAFPSLSDTVKVVPNCIRPDLLDVAPHRFMHGDAFILVTAARLQSEKRVDRGLEAVAHCVGSGMAVKYLVAGDGRERNALESRARELGISSCVEFLGEVDNPAGIIAGADLLLVTSDHEAAPLVFDEARALGTRVVTTETLSAREKVEATGSGVVIDVNAHFGTAVMSEMVRESTREPWSRASLASYNARIVATFVEAFEL